MRNLFVSLLVLSLLSACGMSEGDSVIVLPNDSPFRSDINIARYQVSSNAITGTFVKKDGDKVIISDAKGKFRTFNVDEVFSSSDENAQELSSARLEFYKVYSQNVRGFDKPEILGLIKDKAAKANLFDWFEFLDVIPELEAFNKKLEKNTPVSVDLISDWEDALDSLEDLEDEIAKLSKPNKGRMSFAEVLPGTIKLSVSNAIDQWVHGYSQYKYAIGGDVSRSAPDILALPKVLESALKFIPLRLTEARHLALLKGKQLTDDELDVIRQQTMKRIVDATITAAIKMAKSELGQGPSAQKLAEFLVDKIGYPKDGLAQFYGNKSWDGFLAALKEQDQWFSLYTADSWNGKIKVNREAVLDTSLIFGFESSLLQPVVIISYGQGTQVRGNVQKSVEGVQIKGAVGNWSWLGHIDDAGTLVVKGAFPRGSYRFNVNAKFYSPEATKRLEAAKKVKIQQLTEQLKAEPWYGVTFINRGQHIVPYPVLMKLDFNHGSLLIRDIGYDSNKTASTSFSFEISANGKGSFNDKSGVRTAHWLSGNKWKFSLDEKTHALTASIARSGRNLEWDVVFVPQVDYNARLQMMGSLTNSSWENVTLNKKGAGRRAGNESIKITTVSIKKDLAIFEVANRHAGKITRIRYMAVPALEKGMVISIAKNSRRLTGFREVYYSQSPYEDHAIFRNWNTYWGIAKTSKGSMPAIVKKSQAKAVDIQVNPIQGNALLKAARKQGVIDSNSHVAVEGKQAIMISQPLKPSVRHAKLTHEKPKSPSVRHEAVKTVAHHRPKTQNHGVSKAESQALNQAIQKLQSLL